jgi:hypothetical protein
MNDGVSHFNSVQSGGVPVLGMLTQGTSWFVRPGTGSDNNSGRSPQQALQTLATALSMAQANQNDVIYLMAESDTPGGTTDYQRATTGLLWNKDLVHLIGVNAGSKFSPRSRVALASTFASASPLITVSANGCLFKGVEFFAGVPSTAPLGCMLVTGERNHFQGCHIAGFGHADMDIAGGYDISLAGAQENFFEDCIIGIDTITRSAQVNANIYTSVNGIKATRNIFRECEMRMYAGHATNPQFLRSPTGTVDRSLEFDDCLFLNAVGSGATSLTEAMTVVDANTVVLRGAKCGFVGAGKWNASGSILIMVTNTIAASTSGYGEYVT